METITLPSGVYAVDEILKDFGIIEKPSSNVAFVGTDIVSRRLYVQFKNGLGYMYIYVDLDTLCLIPVVDSIGKFISTHVVKNFPSEKMEKALIEPVPVIIVKGDISEFPSKGEPGVIIEMSEGASIEYKEPIKPDQEPEF